MKEKLLTAEQAALIVSDVLHQFTLDNEGHEPLPSRDVITEAVAKRIAKTGERVNDEFRKETSPVHSLVYQLVSTLRANFRADELASHK